MLITSDVHLGLNRKSHTTKESRKALAESIYQKAMQITSGESDTTCLLGDLFDTYSNDEATITQGLAVGWRCDVVLSGNHDVSNRADKLGSLEFLRTVADINVIITPVGESKHFHRGELNLVAVPHHSTQALFEESLEACPADKLLFLHCNYDNSLTEGLDSSINLSKSMARRLLKKFDYIFIGHEHAPRELEAGRVIIVGSPHPTSFGDISDKFIWHYDEATGKVSKTLVWEEATGYLEIAYEDGMAVPDLTGRQFIQVTGTIHLGQGAALVKFISAIWAAGDCALMVKNAVSVETDRVLTERQDFTSIIETIANALKDTEIEGTWRDYNARINHNNEL